MELYADKGGKYYIIKDGDSVLKLTDAEFKSMRKTGISPMLSRLWEAAKRERLKSKSGGR